MKTDQAQLEAPPALLTPDQVAELLALSRREVLRMARIGELPRVRLNARRIRFRRSDVDKYTRGGF